jgi:hypothetical protein
MLRVSLDDDNARWKWFEYPRPEFSLELYSPTASELSRASARFGLTTDKADTLGFSAYIAEKWFRDFKGIVDQDGKPIPNTPEIRKQLLDKVPGLLAWANGRIADFSAWLDEGNADSGSAC